MQTGGIGINFVTRRGTNKFKGSAKFSLDNSSMESSNLPDALQGRPAAAWRRFATRRTTPITSWTGASTSAARSSRIRLWFWGSYGKQNINIVRLIQTSDKTLLKNTNAKINWARDARTIRCPFFYFNGAKEKLGRSPGPGRQRGRFVPVEPGQLLSRDGVLHPLHGLWKVEDNHTFGSNLFINAKYAYFGWGYGFDPSGGADKDGGVDLDNDSAYGSWFTYTARKPWHIVDVSGSAFKSRGGGNHEFKFGFGYRQQPERFDDAVERHRKWSAFINAPRRQGRAGLSRARGELRSARTTTRSSATPISKGRLTAQRRRPLGSPDRREPGERRAGEHRFPGSAALAVLRRQRPVDLLERHLAARRRDVGARRSDARPSRAPRTRDYAGQLNPFEVTAASPVGGYYTFIAYKWIDTNHDRLRAEERDSDQPGSAVRQQHRSGESDHRRRRRNTIAPNYHANHDNEFILGFDRELMPNFGVGAAYTFRRTYDLPTWNPRIGLTSADYTVGRSSSAARLQRGRVCAEPGEGRRDRRRAHPEEPSRLSLHLQRLEFTAEQTARRTAGMARVALSFND